MMSQETTLVFSNIFFIINRNAEGETERERDKKQVTELELTERKLKSVTRLLSPEGRLNGTLTRKSKTRGYAIGIIRGIMGQWKYYI